MTVPTAGESIVRSLMRMVGIGLPRTEQPGSEPAGRPVQRGPRPVRGSYASTAMMRAPSSAGSPIVGRGGSRCGRGRFGRDLTRRLLWPSGQAPISGSRSRRRRRPPRRVATTVIRIAKRRCLHRVPLFGVSGFVRLLPELGPRLRLRQSFGGGRSEALTSHSGLHGRTPNEQRGTAQPRSGEAKLVEPIVEGRRADSSPPCGATVQRGHERRCVVGDEDPFRRGQELAAAADVQRGRGLQVLPRPAIVEARVDLVKVLAVEPETWSAMTIRPPASPHAAMTCLSTRLERGGRRAPGGPPAACDRSTSRRHRARPRAGSASKRRPAA